MIRYALVRLAQGIPVLLVVASVTFALLRFLPGGPFDREKALPPEILRNIEARYHLDEPVFKQYLRYLADLARGDLGPSYKYVGRDVVQILREAFPVSVKLGVAALALACVGGICAGLVAAMYRGSGLDRGLMLLALLGVSVPSFVLGAALVLGVGLWLGWLLAALWEGPLYAVLPAITLAALPTAYIAQLTRTSVIDVIDLDHVRTARAKGLSELRVHLRHVLRNALLAVVTYF